MTKRVVFTRRGGVWGRDVKTGNIIVSPAKPGPISKPGGKDVHIEVGHALNPALNQQMMPEGEWHVHPRGGGKAHFVQPPSKADRENAPYNINIAVGAGNQRVYFYNGSGVLGEMRLKDFLGELQ
jgi:hypothetical protein